MVAAETTGHGEVELYRMGAEEKIGTATFPPLAYVAEEVKMFERLRLALNGGKFQPLAEEKWSFPLSVKVGKVTILLPGPDLARELEAALADKDLPLSEKYDILHFAGHSYLYRVGSRR